MNEKLPAEQRIKEAFPEMEPSAGHDYVDEIIGLLRVSRMHINDAEERCQRGHRELAEAKNAYINLRDYANSKGLDTTTHGYLS